MPMNPAAPVTRTKSPKTRPFDYRGPVIEPSIDAVRRVALGQTRFMQYSCENAKALVPARNGHRFHRQR